MLKSTTWPHPSRVKAGFELFLDGPSLLVRPLLSESGGHRWQRIPPTEKRGRVQTSTVTVAVFEVLPAVAWSLKDSDIVIFTTKGSGPGGQHRNKVESQVNMRHIPTGIEATASTRSQHQNKVIAREMLESRVKAHAEAIQRSESDSSRRDKVGSGMRGDKIRTYRTQDDQVIDHRSCTKQRLKKIISGGLGDIMQKS